jgi:hypothetical protein
LLAPERRFFVHIFTRRSGSGSEWGVSHFRMKKAGNNRFRSTL